MKVRKMQSNRGNDVPNQFVIETDNGRMFQSYSSNIAFIDKNGQVTLGRNWDYSKTTGKYRNMFLGESKKETQEKLDSGKHLYNPDL